MESISKVTDHNNGGLERIRFAAVADFDIIPRSYNGQISGDITFQAGKGWLNLDFVANTAFHTEVENQSDQGTSYSQSIQCIVNKHTADHQRQLGLLTRQKLIFLIYDRNSVDTNTPPSLVGSTEYWLQYEKDRMTGSGFQELNHYKLKFSGKTRTPSVFYLGNV